MKRAVLYMRINSVEQVDRSFNLSVQKEALENYCATHKIEIVKIYSEHYSAKDFMRPEFSKFLASAKTHHKEIDLLLFVSWDRFSRNAHDAYPMIEQLKKWGIEPQAITQPIDFIDFSDSQSKTKLSIYLGFSNVVSSVSKRRMNQKQK